MEERWGAWMKETCMMGGTGAIVRQNNRRKGLPDHVNCQLLTSST